VYRQRFERGVMSVAALLAAGAAEGAAALGLQGWPDATIDLAHPQLRAVDAESVYDALVFSCTGGVLWKTSVQ
jgi:hypothetical protein